MSKVSFRNRIARSYIVSTALLIGIVFITIFFVVRISVLNHLNDDLQKEVEKHSQEIEVKDGTIALKRHEEWMEREHNTVGVDPVFIEFLDAKGNLIDKSPNLKVSQLLFSLDHADNIFFDSKLADKRIRQVQVPILDNGEKVGYLLVAVSLEGSVVVLHALKNMLIITYPVILFILFLIARFIAGRSIKPISNIIETSNTITKDNLSTRIPLPQNKDELYVLSDTINQLLDRIEQAIEREKSFSSYASHEFRTPLAVLKGTLEVLIRKPREHEEYKEKITYSIKEIDRLNHLVDDLLLLTRFENQKRSVHITEVVFNDLLSSSVERYSNKISSKKLKIECSVKPIDIKIQTDIDLFTTIINNLLSNAIKYTQQDGIIIVDVHKERDAIICLVKDNGIGIRKDELDRIFDKFYRSYEAEHPEIKGFGLGLPIVKRLCQLLYIDITIISAENVGTEVTLTIPNQS